MSRSKNFYKYGLPYLLLVVGGSFGLREFTDIRFHYFSKPLIKPEDFANTKLKLKESGEVTLETEYSKVQNLDIDNWEQKRGPRPWEP